NTRIRAQSLTLLDQTKDQAVCWARLSYYAGLAPADGLEFSTQVAVYPIFPEWVASGIFNRDINIPSRAIQWQDKQYLTEGWLASRTPTQYLTIATRPSARRIDISVQSDRVDIVNKLGTAINLLIVRGLDGKLFWGKSIDRDGKSSLQPVDESEATSIVRKILSDHELQLPVGYPERFTRRGQRVYVVNPIRNFSMQTEIEPGGNQMDRFLDALVIPGAPANHLLQIDNCTYLAVTRTGPEVEMGVSDYSEEASFHVIVGTWAETKKNKR
ncbi:MAG: hypothetical protein JW829_03595, partial [Pirellulales bacterium]|nr:hypothetical protein [Pirellulales bacterium]